MAKQNKVCVNIDQSDESNGGFSDAEKARARTNIGAGDGKIPWVTMGGQTPVVVRSGLSIVKYQAGYCLQNDDASIKLWLAPDFASGDAGKILGIGGGGAIGWRNAPRELPSATQQDSGKALLVDAQGNAVWETIPKQTIPARHFWGYDISTPYTWSGTTASDYTHFSRDGMNITLTEVGDYLITAYIGVYNSGSTNPQGEIQWNVEMTASGATASVLGTKPAPWAKITNTDTNHNGSCAVISQFRVRVSNIEGANAVLNFKWFFKTPAPLTDTFYMNGAMSGASHLCFPNNILYSLSQGVPSYSQSVFAEKI